MMMSQLANIGHTNGNGTTPRRILVLHQQGRDWRLVTLSRDDRESRVVIDSHASIPVADQSMLRRAIEGAEVDLCVRVLPGGSVVARTFSLPAMESTFVEEALELQAEAELPVNIDPHRLASVLLPWAEDLSENSEAIALGWPGATLEVKALEGMDFEYAPTISGLVHVLCRISMPGIACYLDRNECTIEVVMNFQGKTVVRTVRMCVEDDAAWLRQIDAVIVETVAAASIPAEHVQSFRDGLQEQASKYRCMMIVNDDARDELQSLLQGGLNEHGLDWWKQYGQSIVTGLGVFSNQSHLFRLQGEPPAEGRNRIIDWMNWIGHPSHAGLVLVAMVILLSIIPLLGAWGRHAIILAKMGDADQVQRDRRDIAQSERFYELINANRLPVTKLLADVSGCSPHSVQFDELTIDAEQREIRLQGTAGNDFDPLSFKQELERSGIFSNVRIPRNESTTGGGSEFEMVFKIVDEFRVLERPYSEPLGTWLYGDEEGAKVEVGKYTTSSPRGGGKTLASSGSTMQRSNSLRDEQDTARSNANESGNLFGEAELPGADDPVGMSVPPVLSPSDIAAMTKTEAHQAAMARARRLYDKSLDSTTLTRMNDEMIAINRHRQELARKEK